MSNKRRLRGECPAVRCTSQLDALRVARCSSRGYVQSAWKVAERSSAPLPRGPRALTDCCCVAGGVSSARQSFVIKYRLY